MALETLGQDLSSTSRLATHGPRRREPRLIAGSPLRLRAGSGELTPAILLDVSAAGLRAEVDDRFSSLWPLPPGARVEAEFYLGDLAIRNAVLEVVRVESLGQHHHQVGFEFCRIDPDARSLLREAALRDRAARSVWLQRFWNLVPRQVRGTSSRGAGREA
jgi:PilZ domain